MPGVAADEKILVFVLAKSLHLLQLALLLQVRPAEKLRGEHLGTHSAKPAQAQTTLWHQTAHPGVFPRTLQGSHKSLQSGLLEPLEDGGGNSSPLPVVFITRLQPPQPFHQAAASRSENEHGWFSGGLALPRKAPGPITVWQPACHLSWGERHLGFGFSARGAAAASSSPTVALCSCSHPQAAHFRAQNLLLLLLASLSPKFYLGIVTSAADRPSRIVPAPRKARMAVLKKWRTVSTLKLLSVERNCAASVARLLGAAGRDEQQPYICCWAASTLLLYSALLPSSRLAGTLSTGSTCRTQMERRLALFFIENYVLFSGVAHCVLALE